MSDERIRLFVALTLPDQVRDALVAWRADAVGALGGLRLLDQEQLHVTLCFLGWQSSDTVEPIAGACRALAGSGALALAVDQAVWLPARRPRVLAVELDDPGGGLAALQSDLSARLAEGGWYVPERRPYMAHVTVARVRRGATLRPMALPSPPPHAFTASRITLFRSRLSAAGARYEALAGVGLG